jgi:excisionase family DNA binding protein
METSGLGLRDSRLKKRNLGEKWLYMSAQMTPKLTRTGNVGLDALADAIAECVVARLHQSDKPRLLTVNQAAAYIGRTPKALRHMIALDTLPVVREGSRVHLDRADLDRWIDLRKSRS